METTKHTFVVTLQAEQAKDDEEAARRLRAFLKAALRCWGLRCVRLGESTPYAELLESGNDTPVGREKNAG